MKARTLVLASSILAVALLLALSSLTGASPPPAPIPTPIPTLGTPHPPGSEAQTYALGDGRYVAIIPAAPGPEDIYDPNPYIDTYVYSHNPSTSYCNDTKLIVGHDDTEFGNERWRSYLGFHLSSIPSNATIISATFYAYLYSAWGRTSGATIFLQRVTSSWNCPRTWNSKPGSTGYTSRSVGTSTGWYTWNVTSLVQNYWKGKNFGTYPNYGLGLIGPESGTDYKRFFYSKNAGSLRPHLRVEYQLPTPTPTRTRTPTRTPTATPIACIYPLTVNHTNDADGGDCNPTHCSLREAINCANAHAGPDTIYFDIPDTAPGFTGTVWMISPGSALPFLTDSGTTIDGPSQTSNRGDTNPSGPEIVLDGSGTAGGGDGFTINASNCTIRGLDIGGFPGSGVRISGVARINNTIERNYIGVAANGTAAFGNDHHGVSIVGGAADNTVVDNVISGNGLAGVWIGDTGNETGNVIRDNVIGLRSDQSGAIPNSNDGVTIMHGAHHNTIGPGNIISGNTQNGVSIHISDNNTVTGNLIGTNGDGTIAVANGRNGVDVAGSANTIVQQNLISGNAFAGLKIYASGNGQVRGNRIGTNLDGTAAVPNSGEGVIIEDGATNVTIGGAGGGDRNVISGNGGNGIGIKDPETGLDFIIGNYIGTDASGAAAIPNGGHGVVIFDGAHENTVGPDNIIAYNTGDGVRVSDAATLRNTITQNSITENDGLGIENILGGNTELPPPAITGFTDTTVSGTATLPGGAPCAGCTIEAFSDTNGEGRQYIGSTTAAGDGSWTVTFADAPLYTYLTATSTDTNGNTSEFPLGIVDFIITAVEVDKSVVEPLSGVIGVGEDVEFVITVHNTGDTTLTEVEVNDSYPPECLLFTASDPMPDLVDPVAGELTWNDITTTLGDLEPDDEVSFSVFFDAYNLCALGPIALNCVQVDAYDEWGGDDTAHWCDNVTIEPGPPEIEISKVVADPVVCVGDEVHFGGIMGNMGLVPIATALLTDTYDTAFLASLNEPADWGPDDGELVHAMDFIADLGPPGLPPHTGVAGMLRFLAKAATASTVNEIRAMANDDPATEVSDTEAVTILPEAGPCEGNLVVNGDFTHFWTGWVSGYGTPRIAAETGHASAPSLLLGLLPTEADANRYDLAYQDVAIPADAREAWLTFWVNVDNHDPDIHANVFVANVVTMDGASHNIIHTVDSHGWAHVLHDLTPYIGQTVRLFFGAANDGAGVGNLWGYVDEVVICTSRCGPWVPPPDWTPEMCWKAEWPDYAPNGVPDFDQYGYTTGPVTRTVDGPAAALNSLWWFDSKFETGATPPPAVSDHYPLVEALGAWDDHDVDNVAPLVMDLAERMHTDGYPSHSGDWVGTRPDDMANAIRDLLDEKDLLDEYSVTLKEEPTYDLVADEVLRSDDVLLLLGFWEHQPDGWRRLGGHWVTAAGVDCGGGHRIGISDPLINSAEDGYPGLYLPTTDHDPGHLPSLHDDAAYVSHDIYGVAGGKYMALVDYVRWDESTEAFYPDIFSPALWGANTPVEYVEAQADEYQGGPIQTIAEYAVIVSPLPDTVNLFFNPRSAEAAVGQIVPLDIVATAALAQPFDTVQVYIDFDPEVFQVVDAEGNPVTQLTPGEPTLVLQNEVDNEAGEVNYAARTALGEPPLWDRVEVTRLYLRVLRSTPPEGAPIEFSWVTPRRTDVLSGINSVLGRVWEARIRAGDPATVQVHVGLQGRPAPPHARWAVPLTVELLDPTSGTTLQVFGPTTDNQGHFDIETAPGTYDLRVKGMHTLANRWSGLELIAGTNVVNMGELLEGDADNDNDVDGADASIVNLAFGSTPGGANWDPRADFNEDDLVDGVDMGLLASNFGLSGDVEVGGLPVAALPPRALPQNPVRVTSASAPVSIGFSPTSVTQDVGDIFTVDVVIHAGSQPVDTVDAYISFPYDVLEIQAVDGSSAFDLELASSYDSGSGTVHYAATMLGGSLTGDITVATLQFRAVNPADGKWLRFLVWPPTKTDVAYLGESVLTAWPAASVTVEGEARVYLPIVMRNKTW